jgi:hypothetical protein
MNALHHIVLIKFKEGVPDETVESFYTRYQTLDKECGGEEAGILHFRVRRNLDTRKGVALVQFALFSGNDALQAYRLHPRHKELAEDLSHVADWLVGDFIDELQIL